MFPKFSVVEHCRTYLISWGGCMLQYYLLEWIIHLQFSLWWVWSDQFFTVKGQQGCTQKCLTHLLRLNPEVNWIEHYKQKYTLHIPYQCSNLTIDQFLFVQAAIEVPYALVQTVFYVLILYSMVHFDWRPEKFFWFFFFTFFSFLYFTYYGMMCVSLTPNHHFAAIVTSACYALWNLFSGFLIPLTVSIIPFFYIV